jgi:thiol-disulfide isomerase/thioredoxin
MKKYIKVFGTAIVICLLSILSGSLNWNNQLAVVIFLYFLAGLIYNSEEFKGWQFSLIVLLPFMLIYGYFVLKENLIYVYPILFTPPISLLISLFLKKYFHAKKKKLMYFISILYLSFGLLIAYVGMPNWLLYFLIAKDNLHNGNKITGIRFHSLSGNEINDNNLRGKTVVLDFWNTSCGICYKEFPYFEKMVNHFSKDTNIIFYTVNIPMSEDSNRYINVNKSLDYKFNQLFTAFSERDSVLGKFKIRYFPTIVILDQDLNVFFSGTFQHEKRELIDNAYSMINEIEKRHN